jgi:hypothetical protein
MTTRSLQIFLDLYGNGLKRRAGTSSGRRNGGGSHVNLELFAFFLLTSVFLTSLHHEDPEETLLVGWKVSIWQTEHLRGLALTSPMSAFPAAKTLIASSFSTSVATLNAAVAPADLLNRLNAVELEFCIAINLSSVTGREMG